MIPKKNFVIFGFSFAFLLCFVEVCYSQWTQIPSPEEDFGLFRTSFINDSTGFVLGNNYSDNPEDSFYKIYRTHDYGESWELMFQDQTVNYYQIYDFFFVNSTVGFMSASFLTQDGALNSTVLKSIDGGQVWQTINNQDLIPFHVIKFENESVGYGTNGYQGYHSTAYTTDGGLSWETLNIGMVDIVLDDACEVWMVNGQGILQSGDCGENWNAYMMAIELQRDYLFIAKKEENIVVSGNGLVEGSVTFNTGSLAHSSDIGVTWTVMDFPGTSSLSFGILEDEGEGVFLAVTNTWPKSILKTWDGGSTWHYQNYPLINGQNPIFNQIECPSHNVCYASGGSGILRTLNGGGPSIGLADYTVSTIETVKPALGVEIFPNPATDKLNISFSQSFTHPATLTVTDITGREVARQQVPAGVQQSEMDVRALPAGVYVLRMAGSGVEVVRRFVKE